MRASTDFCIKKRSVIEFLTQNVATGDKSWVHHYNPENKRQSIEYHHPGFPSVKKFKTVPSAKKSCSPSFGMQGHALHGISD